MNVSGGENEAGRTWLNELLRKKLFFSLRLNGILCLRFWSNWCGKFFFFFDWNFFHSIVDFVKNFCNQKKKFFWFSQAFVILVRAFGAFKAFLCVFKSFTIGFKFQSFSFSISKSSRILFGVFFLNKITKILKLFKFQNPKSF